MRQSSDRVAVHADKSAGETDTAALSDVSYFLAEDDAQQGQCLDILSRSNAIGNCQC